MGVRRESWSVCRGTIYTENIDGHSNPNKSPERPSNEPVFLLNRRVGKVSKCISVVVYLIMSMCLTDALGLGCSHCGQHNVMECLLKLTALLGLNPI